MANDPVLIAFGAAPRRNGRRRWWQRIGHAYPHDEGNGLTVVLDVVPLDGRIVLLEPDEVDDRRLLASAKRFAKSRQPC